MPARDCEVCLRKNAMYVCRECGREICDSCFYVSRWLCTECYERAAAKYPESRVGRFEQVEGVPLAFKVFMIGFFVILVGIMFIMVASLPSPGSNVSGGGIFLIGPIPIVFGYGQYSFWTIALAAILTIVVVVFFFLSRKKAR
jgi:uncharacterized membrane protein